MQVLVVNCGSSSVKLDVLDAKSGARRARARVERVGEASGTIRIDADAPAPFASADAADALARALPPLLERLGDATPKAVGHRVVHGGERFSAPVRIDDSVEAAIADLSALAPLHNPINLAGIRAARALLPELPHVAVFDTAFHATLPPRARAYALPRALVERHGLRRYGFHGTSHAWLAQRAAEHLGEDLRGLRLVTCHLGNGASATAVDCGRSIDTSMGMTPLEGLVMGTRSGDVDPGIVAMLVRREGLDADGLEQLLNRESGLLGLSGASADMRDIEERAAAGDEACRLAIQVFSHRLRKTIGAYTALLGGVDAIVFSGGIGENSALIRQRVAQRLDYLGARFDEDRNRDVRVSREQPTAEISAPHSRAKLLVIATDEAHAVARASARLVADLERVSTGQQIPVAISARHVHLSDAALATLFGAGHALTPAGPLSQPGQYACVENVTLHGPKRSLERVRVIGPTRARCQVEISRSDEFHLGLDAPVRCSGDLDNTPGITIEGPAGRITIESGVICAQRHIHMQPDDARHFGVAHKDLVEVALDSEGRDTVFGDVVVRVSPRYRLEMHVDTDEGNAAELVRGETGVLIETKCAAQISRRKPGV